MNFKYTYIFKLHTYLNPTELLQQNKKGMYQYLSIEKWKDSSKDVEEFLTSLFFVLESKRRLYTTEKMDRYKKL